MSPMKIKAAIELVRILLTPDAGDESPLSYGLERWVEGSTYYLRNANLSVRAVNILDCERVRTLQDLARYTTTEILGWRNSSEQVVNQLVEFAAARGVTLTNTTDCQSVTDETSAAGDLPNPATDLESLPLRHG